MAVLNNNLSGKQDKIVVEPKTIKTTVDYYIATKTGYTLLNAYTVRDDVSYYVKAIQKRSGTDSYTVIFDNVGNNSTLYIWLVWAKHD